jgi:hypothetical protein
MCEQTRYVKVKSIRSNNEKLYMIVGADQGRI